MHFLVAPDSFKGTFGAHEVAEAIAAGVEAAGATADRCPVADGGEGTMEVLLGALGGERRKAQVHDPLRRPIVAEFGLLGDGETAVVETARACGLTLVAPEEQGPGAGRHLRCRRADRRRGRGRRVDGPGRGRRQRHHRRRRGERSKRCATATRRSSFPPHMAMKGRTPSRFGSRFSATCGRRSRTQRGSSRRRREPTRRRSSG